MKLLRVLNYLLTVGILLFLTVLFVKSRDSVAVSEEQPVVFSYTNTPEIPESVVFCGQKIDLRRYNMRERMDRELSSFTYLHSSTMLLIKRANRFFPVIEPILKANGIPDDFKYLAVIESNLDPLATSPVRAVGPWQFMENTAKSYGLRITATADERRNVAKATEAACKYLKDAYRKYGDWVAVAASYNAGMGRISGQLAQQDESSVLNLHFVEETSRYPYRIFAAKQIFENPYKYGFVFYAENLYRPIKCKEVTVNSDIPDLVAFAKRHGITYYDLRYFNPWLKDTKLQTAGQTYKILIPEKDDLFYDKPNTYVHDMRWVR